MAEQKYLCPGCDKEISGYAFMCPECGRPLKEIRTAGWAFIHFIIWSVFLAHLFVLLQLCVIAMAGEATVELLWFAVSAFLLFIIGCIAFKIDYALKCVSRPVNKSKPAVRAVGVLKNLKKDAGA